MNNTIEAKAYRVQEIIREREKLDKEKEKLNRELEALFLDNGIRAISPSGFSVGKRVPISKQVFAIIRKAGEEGIAIKEIVQILKTDGSKIRQSIAYLKKRGKIVSSGLWGVYKTK